MIASQHDAGTKLYQDGQLSVGIVLPVRQTEHDTVDFQEQVELARLADKLGFTAVWVRDVPLNGPWYPETFGHPDPFSMLGAIAMATSRLSIGTAATVLTLRHPLHIAKAAITLDRLTGGRFVLGLGSGDRREEFAAFDADTQDHKILFQRHWSALAAALEQPSRIAQNLLAPAVTYEMRPSALSRIPMVAIGSAGQSLEWIARNCSGWTTYHRPPDVQRDRHAMWRRAVDRVATGQFRSFGVGVHIELLDNASAPADPIHLGYRTGTYSLSRVLGNMRDAGVHHVLLNLPPTGEPPRHKLERIAADVLLPLTR
ncbi:TIGR03571 family LLM class oxidoreductase [Bradyrhizobium mercantei]|uniref:TIGR03571 family LLM class oxidoreductase n=1 Tax=Bradyrhizobium mercantei TaxID=1904807 RepID=UPI0009764C1A|nr:TIGR03571 family LLM class oxidoreductase [Bradyrhizobium mercantei]